jgi:hypothetical protein
LSVDGAFDALHMSTWRWSPKSFGRTVDALAAIPPIGRKRSIDPQIS